MPNSRTEYFREYRKTEQYRKSQLRYRQTHREEKREYDKKHSQVKNANRRARYHADPEKFRKKMREYLKAHPEKARAYQNRFYHKYPEKQKAYSNKHRLANLQKFSERQKEYSKKNPKYSKAASLSQLIPLKNFCEECGSTENLQKHHPNYSEPKKIETLCFKCHLKKHGNQPVLEMIING